ncbi:MAG: hypothetical protein Q4F67_01665, partial [Propionibacteriaceae bacterium]|nr:hypothetical protein [Propionibacteriaceae bacterium]
MKPRLFSGGLAAVLVLSACSGQAGTRDLGWSTGPAGQAPPEAASVTALAEAANAETVHQVQITPEEVSALVWTGSTMELWVERAGERESVPLVLPGGHGLGSGKPAAEFPLGDVEAAREAAGNACPAAVVTVKLLPSGIPTTTADCEEPGQRLAAFINGEQ